MAIVRSEPMQGGKRAAVAALFALASLIILTGVAFGVYSVLFNVNYMVLNSQIPGYVFAAVAVFLGVRYFISVVRMNKRLREMNVKFDWNNFKTTPEERAAKARKTRKK